MSIIKGYYNIFPEIDKNGVEIGEVGRPVINLQLNYRHGKIFGPLGVLIDSGSDYNLYPCDIAKCLGISLKKGKARTVVGIGEKSMQVYRHFGLKMFIEGYSFETFVDFGEEIVVPLLGQQGFFDKFRKINFSRGEEKFSLEY